MYTSVAILALAGFLVAPAPTPKPDLVWWRDYQIAQQRGVKEGKPLAVFVGAGQGGYHALAREGELNDTVKEVLAEKYVCVYLDTTSTSQTELIKSLAVTKGKGLVLSDRTGSIQAYHHDGTLTEAELATQLQHFADPAVEVNTTVTNADIRRSYYSGASSNLPQAYYPPVTFARSC
jgi:hypothetical protein